MNALILNCSPVRDGATAEIVHIVAERLRGTFTVRTVCIDDYPFDFCRGCRRRHRTASCFMRDGVDALMGEMERADVIVSVSPSYWADVPGQFKAFIDRCTPWSNTYEPHAALSAGKRGYAIVLRTGLGMRECQRIIETLEHFYGHLEIERRGSLGLCSVEFRESVASRKEEIEVFCENIIRE